jgi:hypothetical protein
VLTVVAGATLGVLVTLTSIGADALGVVFLAYLYPLRLPSSRLIAADIVHAAGGDGGGGAFGEAAAGGVEAVAGGHFGVHWLQAAECMNSYNSLAIL